MNLDQWMKDNGVSNTALAVDLGVSQPFVSRLRAGERGASLKLALKLADKTGLPPASFIKDEAA